MAASWAKLGPETPKKPNFEFPSPLVEGISRLYLRSISFHQEMSEGEFCLLRSSAIALRLLLLLFLS